MKPQITIFCCYAHEDQGYLRELKNHLSVLERQGSIKPWADIDVLPGDEAELEVTRKLNSAEIILLLVSPAFMASGKCDQQMMRALERREQHEAEVIPLYLRSTNFQQTPIGKLQSLPMDGEPIVSNRRRYRRDDVWKEVVEGLAKRIENQHPSKQTNMGASLALTIRKEICDFSHYIHEKTHHFVGRKFVFDAVTHFTQKYPCGYYFIRGDPGIGKSSLIAQMVKANGYVHHFNIRSECINTTETFLRNICAQLIGRYQLNYSSLPTEAMRDARFLNQILKEVSEKLGSYRKTIILVDALDEADMTDLPSGSNILLLPRTLPQGIYIIVTMRRISSDELSLNLDRKRDDTLDIEQHLAENTADTSEYIGYAVEKPGIQTYIVAQKLDNTLFVKYMVEKSEGNFMYLSYVLPEIEHGAYTDLSLEAIPVGLQNYYEDHWRRMRGKDKDGWVAYKVPVIMALMIAKEPISIELIQKFSKVREENARVYEVLQEWWQFLHVEQVSYEGQWQRRYRIYHSSFYDFILKKEEIKTERVSTLEAKQKIVMGWKELGLLDE